MSDLFRNLFVLCLFAAVACSPVFALTDAELIAVRDGFDARRDDMLDDLVANPYPDISGSWGKFNYALAALYCNKEVANANDEIVAGCQLYLDGTEDWEDFHWRGNLLFRIYRFFAHDSQYYPNRLTAAAEAKICETLWQWAKIESRVSETNIDDPQRCCALQYLYLR